MMTKQELEESIEITKQNIDRVNTGKSTEWELDDLEALLEKIKDQS